MTIESVIAAAQELASFRAQIENLTNEKSEFLAKVEAINVKLAALRTERDKRVADIKRDAAGI
jgi:hypothetical protein